MAQKIDTVKMKCIRKSYFVNDKGEVYFTMHNRTSSGFFVPFTYAKEGMIQDINVSNPAFSIDSLKEYRHLFKSGLPGTIIGFQLPNVDRASFVALNKNYARDKHAAYYRNTPIRNAISNTFTTLVNDEDEEYAYDDKQVYYKGTVINKANPSAFKIVERSGYSKDDQFIFYEGVIVEGADPHSFTSLPNEKGIRPIWYKDQLYVYYNGQKLEDAKAASFKPMDIYGIDGPHVYIYGKKIAAADAPTFHVLTGSDGNYLPYACDAKNVYYLGHIIDKAHPGSFQLLNKEGSVSFSGYAKDNNYVFYNGKLLINADAASFQLLYTKKEVSGKPYDAEDMNHKYFCGEPL